MIMRECRGKDVYYLVDYDFKDHKEGRIPARIEILKLFQAKSLREITSTTSVIPCPDLSLAIEVKKILDKHGAIANVREARSISIA
jgi:hypothetical protein